MTAWYVGGGALAAAASALSFLSPALVPSRTVITAGATAFLTKRYCSQPFGSRAACHAGVCQGSCQPVDLRPGVTLTARQRQGLPPTDDGYGIVDAGLGRLTPPFGC